MARPGFQYIYDLHDLAGYPDGTDWATDADGNYLIRVIPFSFSVAQSYLVIFYEDYAGNNKIAFAADGGLVASGGSPYTITISGTFDILNFDYAQYNDIIFIAQPDRTPMELIRSGHTSWTIQDQTITSIPASWSGANGYPETVAIYEQRVAYGGTVAQPSTVWFSKSGYPKDFSVGSPQVASDAVTYTIGGGKKDKIQWLSSHQQLIIGTLGAEHAISGKAGSPLSFESVSALQFSAYGSEGLKPIEVGESILFVRRLGSQIFRYAYDNEVTGGWKGLDLSALNYEVLQDPGDEYTYEDNVAIKSWTFQDVPNSVVWMTDNYGRLLGLTNSQEHGIVAWHTHKTSEQDKFICVGSMPGDFQDTELWSISRRECDGDYKFYLERMYKYSRGKNLMDYRLLDSFKTGTSVVSGSTALITGIEHLAGRSLNLWINGKVYPDAVVSGTGTIDVYDTIGTLYGVDGKAPLAEGQSELNWVVGLPYPTEIKPTPPDFGNVPGGIIGAMTHATGSLVHLYRTAPGAVVSIENGYGTTYDEPIVVRPYDEENFPTDPYPDTVTFDVNPPSNYKREFEYSIKQEFAMPICILGITDILAIGG